MKLWGSKDSKYTLEFNFRESAATALILGILIGGLSGWLIGISQAGNIWAKTVDTIRSECQ